MTTRKTTKKDAVEIVGSDDTGASPAELEAVTDGAEAFTFTAEIDGEELEFVDHWPQAKKPPIEMLLMGNENTAGRLAPGLLAKLIGEEAMFALAEQNVDVDAFQTIVQAWAKARGLKN